MPNEPSLLPPFFELIRGSPAEVVGHLMGSLDRILPSLYKCVSEQNNCQISRLQLDHIVIGCNRLIRRTSSWRAQYSYLQNIAVLRHLIPVKDLFISFVPMLKQEVLTTRAIPCRVAASITLLLFMRENPNEIDRQSIIDFFIHSVANHQNCHRRRLFLDMIPEIIVNFSRKFFHAHFLTPILEMANDKVASIRLQLCHMLSKIKANLYLPQDEEILLRVEGIIRDLLSKEQNSSTRQLIQTYACELSRAETRNKNDKSDELKQKAENEIWNQKELTVEGTDSNASEKCLRSEKELSMLFDKNDGHLDKGPWRTHIQRSKTAIVRPQPQVVVTQRSPSPMPRNFRTTVEERKSRLPLATTQNNRYLDTKHKTTTTTASPATSSVSRTLPLTSRRGSTQTTTKSSLSTGRRSSTTSAGKPPTGLSADNTNARRSSATTVMSRSVSSLNGKVGLMPSQSTDSVTLFGQGLMKVRSFSNIARTPSHLTNMAHAEAYGPNLPTFADLKNHLRKEPLYFQVLEGYLQNTAKLIEDLREKLDNETNEVSTADLRIRPSPPPSREQIETFHQSGGIQCDLEREAENEDQIALHLLEQQQQALEQEEEQCRPALVDAHESCEEVEEMAEERQVPHD
ncbi:hypothetical protein QQG55_11010 [Brugia pahangi]